MICPDVFEMLYLDAVVEHQFQGFGADSLVPVRFSYPVAHLAIFFSDRDVAGFMCVVADAADGLASLFQHNRPCRVVVEISLDYLPTFPTDLCAGHPARGPTSGSEAYLKSASASDSCQWRSKILSVSIRLYQCFAFYLLCALTPASR